MSDADPARLRELLADRDFPCPECEYNLRDLESGTCPECGFALTEESIEESDGVLTLEFLCAAASLFGLFAGGVWMMGFVAGLRSGEHWAVLCLAAAGALLPAACFGHWLYARAHLARWRRAASARRHGGLMFLLGFILLAVPVVLRIG